MSIKQALQQLHFIKQAPLLLLKTCNLMVYLRCLHSRAWEHCCFRIRLHPPGASLPPVALLDARHLVASNYSSFWQKCTENGQFDICKDIISSARTEL